MTCVPSFPGVTYVQKRIFRFIERLLTKYQVYTKLPQISHTQKSYFQKCNRVVAQLLNSINLMAGNFKTAWPTRMSMPVLSSLDNLH